MRDSNYNKNWRTSGDSRHNRNQKKEKSRFYVSYLPQDALSRETDDREGSSFYLQYPNRRSVYFFLETRCTRIKSNALLVLVLHTVELLKVSSSKRSVGRSEAPAAKVQLNARYML